MLAGKNCRCVSVWGLSPKHPRKLRLSIQVVTLEALAGGGRVNNLIGLLENQVKQGGFQHRFENCHRGALAFRVGREL